MERMHAASGAGDACLRAQPGHAVNTTQQGRADIAAVRLRLSTSQRPCHRAGGTLQRRLHGAASAEVPPGGARRTRWRTPCSHGRGSSRAQPGAQHSTQHGDAQRWSCSGLCGARGMHCYNMGYTEAAAHPDASQGTFRLGTGCCAVRAIATAAAAVRTAAVGRAAAVTRRLPSCRAALRV